ncbi:MAG: hypothetical protein WC862_05250 [Patescibacteria group bacterium]
MTNILETNHADYGTIKDSPACCAENKKNDSDPLKNSFVKKNFNQTLIAFLALAVVVNIAVMGFFTFTVNNKLNNAIEAAKPQPGSLILVIPQDCPACGDLSATSKKIKAQDIELAENKIIAAESDEGKTLIEKFGLQKLPALIFASPEKIKPRLKQSLETGARAAGEDTLIWEQNQPPYVDIKTNSVAGLVSLTYLTDKSCADCYDAAKTQRPILQRFGIAIIAENTVDISEAEGNQLIDAYRITALPTVILSSEAGEYKAFSDVWKQVGTIEEDGSFVFREMNALNATYKDLKTGKIIKTASE